MRSPEEIKKAFSCSITCECLMEECAYRDAWQNGEYGGCFTQRGRDALAYIQQLEAERDAAVEDLRGRCFACVHVKPHDKFPNLNACQFISFAVGGQGKRTCEHWQWRGVREDA